VVSFVTASAQMNRYQGALHLFYLPNSYRLIPGARGKHLPIR
jgi:hypothetical protein